MSYAVKQIKMPIPVPEASKDRTGNPVAQNSIDVTLFEPAAMPDPLKRLTVSALATLVWADDPNYREADCFAHRLAEHGVRVLTVDYAAAPGGGALRRDGLLADSAAQLRAANRVATVLRWVDAHYGGLIFVGGSGIAADFALQAALTQAVSAAAGIAGSAAGVLLIYPELLRLRDARVTAAGAVPGGAAANPAVTEIAGGVAGATQTADMAADTAPIGAVHAKPATAAAGQERASLAAITAMIEQIKAAERVNAAAAAARAVQDALFETVELPPEPAMPTEPIAVLQLQEKQLAKLPDLIVLHAELDPARQGSEAFISRVRAAGVRVIETAWQNAAAGYLHEQPSGAAGSGSDASEIASSTIWILQQLNPKAAADRGLV